jgi:hypothetical protein
MTAVAWYVRRRLAHGSRRRPDQPRMSPATTPDLVRLIAPLRAAYRARWEESLLRWSAGVEQCRQPAC